MSRRRWHQGINIIDKAKKWISELDLRPILSEIMHDVDFACRYQLSDTALMEAMSKMFGARADVFTVDPLIWGVVERGMTTAPVVHSSAPSG
ncbi:hypothetical protein PC116_g21597 [Phytophthora cactorum]|uniref:Uncharacterized protein n=1 Tax=Phytophthora cactorum TaxID=29920 RepID=A0A8T1K7F1_9STRA|nr:hypothetical protein PC112_g17760 [Phytophthora cactorum]KAG2808788.1 hypothetical protein PC111_g16342 [Phytophthora cactorum]KAG2913503.1 hypothetical protein PC117_g18558 [Phytophthora cactorum]KAG2993388.1 hypothetical protein PC119_g18478 [Phytophthora cactorum]KAG3067791.1 hypothetical protein PC122_g17230 [Phytophthora cactorum]